MCLIHQQNLIVSFRVALGTSRQIQTSLARVLVPLLFIDIFEIQLSRASQIEKW